MKMTFGKYKGQEVENVPAEYLEWALSEVDFIYAPLREEMEDQLALKQGRGVARGDDR